MAIEFSKQEWNKVKDDTRKWWSGQIGRPLIQVCLKGRKLGRKPASHPYHRKTSFYGFNISADEIADAWNYELCQYQFMGDAFPEKIPNFGPDPIAAYMGAVFENGTDAVWFHLAGNVEITDLTFEYLPDNPWFIRTKEILAATVKRWQGSVQLGLTDRSDQG